MRTTGQVRGTPAYMAPEYLLSVMDEVAVDERADVYSLGHILYEMLLGRHAYSNPDGTFPSKVQLIRKHLEPANGRIAPLPELLEGFPEYLWSELDKTLRRDPNDRPRGAQELASNFGALLANYQHERLEREEFYDALQSPRVNAGKSSGAAKSSGAPTSPVQHRRTSTLRPIRTSKPLAEAELDGPPTFQSGATAMDEAVSTNSAFIPHRSSTPEQVEPTSERPVSIVKIAGLVACGLTLSFAAVGLAHVAVAVRAAARLDTNNAERRQSLPVSTARNPVFLSAGTQAADAFPRLLVPSEERTAAQSPVPSAVSSAPPSAPINDTAQRDSAPTYRPKQPGAPSVAAQRSKRQPRPTTSGTHRDVLLPWTGAELKTPTKPAGRVDSRSKAAPLLDDDRALF